MSEALEQLARLRFGAFLSEVHGTDDDELYRIFKTPEAVVEYLQVFGLDVTYEPNRPLSPTVRTVGGDGLSTPRFILLVLNLAPQAEAYTAADMDAWSKVAPINKPAMPSLTVFRRFAKARVPGVYAGTLWKLGASAKDILGMWRSGVPLEYAVAATHR